MPATDYQGSATGFASIGRSMDGVGSHHDSQSGLEIELEAFQRQVADRFLDLCSSSSAAAAVVGSEELLSVQWVRKLLDVFLCCQEEFRAILFNHKSMVLRPPLDRMVSDYFERSVKALDVCNAVRDGIEQIRQWQKLLEIVLIALDGNRNLGEGQFRRAKKALIDLAIGMLDEKDPGSTLAHRNRSFGRNNFSRDHHRQLGHFRSLSWSVSRSWSAARQLQAIANNVSAPRANEVVATGGLAVAVFTMNSVLLFVMWALVAAIPCQDRGLQVHFPVVHRNLPWSGPMTSLHERIIEESKKRDRKNACGLLKEIHQIEKCSRVMSELTDSVQFPLTEEKETEVRQRVEELSQVCGALKNGLDPLERQVREVFHRIVRSRTEGLDSLGKASYSE
ncbi:protein BYPASS1-LIKE [Cannabis sativa]|uniref:Uncharacterized protein n=1 Tax=Cannabis sativa TaxID=3483 RepID=A0A7J6GML1_CANSA|nr:protein BYPASS1-LIKE [Cannabis sativa]KAF4375583.1 hypothetical protein G4B88_022230 [Cannabis sativa]KAF4384117.1 hypothetical protein F8388_001355 [Cannabis sativa]